MKEKQIKISLEAWKALHKFISYFVDNYGTKFSYGNIIDIIIKNTKKEDIIQWTKKNLKN